LLDPGYSGGMAELKTKPTTQDAREFLRTVEPAEKQRDSLAVLELMERITGERAVMWGTSIVGFGSYHYKSERSRQEGDWPLVGFSPRKQNLTLYIMAGNHEKPELLAKLGKHKTGGSCLYIKRLSDVDETVLATLIDGCYQHMKATNAPS
jgi:hypothetical protein